MLAFLVIALLMLAPPLLEHVATSAADGSKQLLKQLNADYGHEEEDNWPQKTDSPPARCFRLDWWLQPAVSPLARCPWLEQLWLATQGLGALERARRGVFGRAIATAAALVVDGRGSEAQRVHII